jgi:catechol 2,3-dioxygenase-like lactoylglutathione lyase family enzyme
MSNTWKAENVSAMLATTDMEASITFFRDVLGFTIARRFPEYTILERDRRLVHLKLAWAPPEVMKTVNLHSEIYLEVTGIRALWEHVKTFNDRYKTRDLFDRDYGMTEFHIREVHSCLVFVGEVTSEASRAVPPSS